MAFLRPADEELFLVILYQQQTPEPLFDLGLPITSCEADIAITGDEPVASHDPIEIYAGEGISIPWYYKGTRSLQGQGLVFVAQDRVLGTTIVTLRNEVAGGSELEFTTPPLDSDGLPQLDDSGKRMPGFLNFHGEATSGAFIRRHKYQVLRFDPAEPDDPRVISAAAFVLNDRAGF